MKCLILFILFMAFAFPLQLAGQATAPCSPAGKVQFLKLAPFTAPDHLFDS